MGACNCVWNCNYFYHGSLSPGFTGSRCANGNKWRCRSGRRQTRLLSSNYWQLLSARQRRDARDKSSSRPSALHPLSAVHSQEGCLTSASRPPRTTRRPPTSWSHPLKEPQQLKSARAAAPAPQSAGEALLGCGWNGRERYGGVSFS